MDEKLRALIEWIAAESEAEPMSGFLPGGPYINVSAFPLLDRIGELFGLTREEVGEVFNSKREKVEEERRHSK